MRWGLVIGAGLLAVAAALWQGWAGGEGGLLSWSEDKIADGKDKIVVITGASAGLGLAAATVLAEKGYNIIMGCRSKEKGEQALSEIMASGQVKGKVVVEILDLMEPDSIDAFVEKVTSRYNRVDYLLNNAGVMAISQTRNSKGWEGQIAVNHLGHFILTLRLLPLLAKGVGRVVMHSSSAHAFPGLDIEDLNYEKRPYDAFRAYASSKRANLLFAHELNRRARRVGVTVTAAHPGWTVTELQHRASGDDLFRSIVVGGNKLGLGMTPRRGVLSLLRAAFDAPENAYVGPAFVIAGPPVVIGKTLEDYASFKFYKEEEAKKLWDKSEDLTEVTSLLLQD
eukprot:746391-Hanusia_phi.AAC.15